MDYLVSAFVTRLLNYDFIKVKCKKIGSNKYKVLILDLPQEVYDELITMRLQYRRKIDDDWFTSYVNIAKPYKENGVKLILDQDNRLFNDIMTEVDKTLRSYTERSRAM